MFIGGGCSVVYFSPNDYVNVFIIVAGFAAVPSSASLLSLESSNSRIEEIHSSEIRFA